MVKLIMLIKFSTFFSFALLMSYWNFRYRWHSSTVIQTQCFVFLGVLWYWHMSPFYFWRQISVLQYMHSYVVLKTCFLSWEFDKYFYDTFLPLEANFSCVFFEDKVFFNHESLIYVKNTKKINVLHIFILRKHYLHFA